jgi:drug/metabolite transporter (DMT)-like permease
MVAMTIPGSGGWSSLNFGDVLTVACAIVYAVHLLVLGYFSKREQMEAVAFGQIACVALLSAAFMSFEGPFAHWSSGLTAAIVTTAVFATALAFALQTWGQKYTTATRTALIFALEPVFALVTAVAFGEKARWLAVLGGALILGGILAVELKPAEDSYENERRAAKV